jgi:hypothetical protein
MSADHHDGRADEFVVVDLTLRLRPNALARLNAAAARAGAEQVPTVTAAAIDLDDLNHARARAVRMLKLRRQRETSMGFGLFADPCWDMLLDLFVRRCAGMSTSVSSACISANVPATTALRHLAIMIERGLVTKQNSTKDNRVQYVDLSEAAFQQMVVLLTSEAAGW